LVFATIDCLVFSQPLASAPRPRILTNINGFYFASLAFALIVGVFGSISVESPRLPLSSKHISVISTNIQYGWTNDYRFEPHRHVQWLTQYKANLIGVQEVNRGHTSGAGIDLFQYYRFMLPGYWMYGDANFGFGNAIYSQFPVLEYKLLRYKASDMLRRSCLRALVNIRGVPVEFWVTHLSHLDPPNPVRQAQIAELREWLKSSKYPWILTGDLNAEPNSPEIQSLLPIVAPIFQKYPDLLKEHTYSSLKPQRRIDYIFWSHHFESHQLRILDNKGNSDHKPVFATLELIDKDATTDK
jgi:endonuclease/exonuclease/phosphatase family metal-dependent hydrolase